MGYKFKYMAKERQLMTLKQASEKYKIPLNTLYYHKNNPDKMKEYGLTVLKVGSTFLVEAYR